MEKIDRNTANPSVDITNIGRFLRMHRNDLVEFESRNLARNALRNTGEQLIIAENHASPEIKSSLVDVFSLWDHLKITLTQNGENLEKTKEILNLKRDIDFAEAHINDKVDTLAD